MAGAFTDYAEGVILGNLLKNAGTAMPATLYLGLLTAQPADTGSQGTPADGTEVTNANGYLRVALTGTNWTAAASGTTTQYTYTGTITFPQATGAWGTITGWCLYDTGTTSGTGKAWAYGAISPTQAISSGQTPSFSANAIVLSLD